MEFFSLAGWCSAVFPDSKPLSVSAIVVQQENHLRSYEGLGRGLLFCAVL